VSTATTDGGEMMWVMMVLRSDSPDRLQAPGAVQEVESGVAVTDCPPREVDVEARVDEECD
jgi:hypothetical protein